MTFPVILQREVLKKSSLVLKLGYHFAEYRNREKGGLNMPASAAYSKNGCQSGWKIKGLGMIWQI